MKNVFKLLETEENVEKLLQNGIAELFIQGGVNATILEVLTHIKIRYPEIFKKYEQQILVRLGLFFKNPNSESFEDNIFRIYDKYLKTKFKDKFAPTPIQADIVNKISTNRIFSFSSPTSTGKSSIFRYLLSMFSNDIVIIVPSRALINEYYKRVCDEFQDQKDINILTFIDKINIKRVKRSIFIVTPERSKELFGKKNELNIGLVLFDEAQLSEDIKSPRGMFYDSIIRRIVKNFSNAKLIFAYPFIKNPEAQFKRNKIEAEDKLARPYQHKNVGQIFFSYDKKNYTFAHFGSDKKVFGRNRPTSYDPLEAVLKKGGNALIYCTKSNIYDRSIFKIFEKYFNYFPNLENDNRLTELQKKEAMEIVDRLSSFIGATDSDNSDHWSLLIYYLKRRVVVHHGSIPLIARTLIEEFTQKGYCKICFATSTLEQGINMPFDLVWIHRFNKTDTLGIKNLIGRAGRSTLEAKFDFGQIIIKKNSANELGKIVSKEEFLSIDSMLDDFVSDPNDDYKEYKEAIRNDKLSDEFNMALSEVDRLRTKSTQEKIEFIINSMFAGDKLEIEKIEKLTLKFIEIYETYLNRKVEDPERNILNTTMQILLWRVKGKGFSQIVSFRYSYITRLKERKEIRKSSDPTSFDNLEANYSPVYQAIPKKNLKAIGLNWNSKQRKKLLAKEIDYDRVMVDTYDYIDKIIGFRVGDVYFCAFIKYHEDETKDVVMREKALRIANIIRYGTDDETEIMLLRYGFDFEDFEWLLPIVSTVTEDEIVFKNLDNLSDWQRSKIERFI